MFQGQKVSREQLFNDDTHSVASDDFVGQEFENFSFDFDIIDVEHEISDAEKETEEQEEEKEYKSVNKQHTLQLFSNAKSCTIKLDQEESNDISDYFADTFRRDESWDSIANGRKRPISFYVTDVSIIDDQVKPSESLSRRKQDFNSVAISGDTIYQSAYEPVIKLEIDAIRESKKVVTLKDLQPPSIKPKNKRGQISRLKFKSYQSRLKELKERNKKDPYKRDKQPSKKPFLSEKPKFKVTKPSTIGKSKFRTE